MTPIPTILCILDGFGLNPNPKANAVALARKPCFERLWNNFPHTTLCTHGERVGLPDGQMGNSEVGHLNIGAGRVVEQWLLKIARALKGNFKSDYPAYTSFLSNLSKNSAIHLLGLFSDGGVHSDKQHLYLLIEKLLKDTNADLVLQVIADGRDTAPQALLTQISELIDLCSKNPRLSIASVCGRFYAMDRDKRWDRTKAAYDCIVLQKGKRETDLLQAIKNSYQAGINDEFIEPFNCAARSVKPDDAYIFWNFRADRMRQIVQALSLQSFTEFERSGPVIGAKRCLCFSEYDAKFNLPFLFRLESISNSIGEVVSNAGLRQLRVAETEKYPHVTYFLNGGREEPFPAEDRKLAPSPRDVKTYDLKPEMSASQVCDIVVSALENGTHDLIIVNFANCDMVGHTGVLDAAIKAVETVDICLDRIVTVLEKKGGQAIVIADHGNAEQMIDYETGVPHTAHTKFPVPCLAIQFSSSDHIAKLRDGGALCDVAPTLLSMMGLVQPKEMLGKCLTC